VFEPAEFIDAGSEVVVVATMHGHGDVSDAPMRTTFAFVYEVRDGMIVRDRAFTSRYQALEAAGLAE
jgi:ketosteroid isomerase-like protein